MKPFQISKRSGWVSTRVDIGPGAPLVRHAHPGEEIIYILEGPLEADFARGLAAVIRSDPGVRPGLDACPRGVLGHMPASLDRDQRKIRGR